MTSFPEEQGCLSPKGTDLLPSSERLSFPEGQFCATFPKVAQKVAQKVA